MMRVRRFCSDDCAVWDAFCEKSLNATLLHTRAYLGYHGDRFDDKSVVVEDAKGRWIGALPAARDPDDAECVISHPGITYGGVVHSGRVGGARMLEAFGEIAAHYQREGFTRLIYKAIPVIYHQAPAQDDLYALFRYKASRYRCDLGTTIRLDNRLTRSERRRRALRKAERAEIRIVEGVEQLDPLWTILRANLGRRHGVKPVHSEAEIRLLAERFAERIRVVCAWLGDALVAGIVVFEAGPADHAQYIASNERGQEANALDAVFEAAISMARERGATWFDFGISTENQGEYLNEGLDTFKAEFGGGGTVHEYFELRLGGTQR